LLGGLVGSFEVRQVGRNAFEIGLLLLNFHLLIS
jgi:hypothetical protein